MGAPTPLLEGWDFLSFHFLRNLVQEIFYHPYYSDQRSDLPVQHRAIGWVRGRLYSVIFEIREDAEGEFYHLVTSWKATTAERKLYEEHTT